MNVPPPTIHNDRDSLYPQLKDGEIDDGQYREDPKIYLDPRYNSKPSKAATQFRANPAPVKPVIPAQNYNFNSYQTTPAPYVAPQTERPPFQTRFSATAQPNYYQAPQQNYYQQPQQNYYQAPAQPSYYQPRNNYYSNPTPVDIFQGHPATDFNINTGSYSVNYVG